MKPTSKLQDGASCQVIGGTHEGKSVIVRDIKTSKTGLVTITVMQPDGEREAKSRQHSIIRGTGFA